MYAARAPMSIIVSAHEAVAFVMIEDDVTVLHVEFSEKRARTS
jgi:hypothetical protein